MLTMYDATSAASIPLDPTKLNTREKAIAAKVAVAAYNDRDFRTDFAGAEARFPILAELDRIISIASTFTTKARVIDYERGNPCYGDPDGVAKWVLEMLAENVYMPGGYADRADMPALQAAYVRHKVPRDKSILWLAAPGADPTPFLNEGFNLVQKVFAGQFDVSICEDNVFPPLVAPKPKPPLEHTATVTFKGEHGEAHIGFGEHVGWHILADHGGDWHVQGG